MLIIHIIYHLGWTPLHHSAGRRHFEVVKYLVDHDANVNIQNRSGEYIVIDFAGLWPAQPSFVPHIARLYQHFEPH